MLYNECPTNCGMEAGGEWVSVVGKWHLNLWVSVWVWKNPCKCPFLSLVTENHTFITPLQKNTGEARNWFDLKHFASRENTFEECDYCSTASSGSAIKRCDCLIAEGKKKLCLDKTFSACLDSWWPTTFPLAELMRKWSGKESKE